MDSNSFHDAAKGIDLAKVKALLDENPNLINSYYKEGLTLLHWAAYGGNKDAAEYLLAKGADVNVRGKGGYTPLHSAAAGGCVDVVKLLLANGADTNAKDISNTNRYTPLHMAVNKEVAELLLAHGSDVYSNQSFQTPIELAVLDGRNDVVEFLLAHESDINTSHTYGFTLLHWAALRGNKTLVELLLANKADVNAKNNDCSGSTPLHMAAASVFYGHWVQRCEVAEQSRKDVVLLLLANGARINVTDNLGETPLHKAAKDGNKYIVKLLYQHGALPRIITAIFWGLRNMYHRIRSR